MVEHIKINIPLGKSGHATVSFNLKYSRSSATAKGKLVPRYCKGKHEEMRDHLQKINWERVLGTENTQDNWQRFEEIMLQATEKCVPKKTRKVFEGI